MKKIAIVLNANARSVNSKTIDEVQKVADQNDAKVFVSHSLEDLTGIALHIFCDEYDVVMCGGGDGTFSSCVTQIYNTYLNSDGKLKKNLPTFGILRMGTGNALADVLWIVTGKHS